jgi:hypothetical protein
LRIIDKGADQMSRSGRGNVEAMCQHTVWGVIALKIACLVIRVSTPSISHSIAADTGCCDSYVYLCKGCGL